MSADALNKGNLTWKDLDEWRDTVPHRKKFVL